MAPPTADNMPVVASDLEATREAFYSGARSHELPFVLNDSVNIISGDAAGVGGAIISVEQVEPLMYLVERGDGGGDLRVAVDQLRLFPESC